MLNLTKKLHDCHLLQLLVLMQLVLINTLRPRQNGRHFADDIFKCFFLNENASISIKISLKFVPKGPINNIPALVQIIAWRRPGDKPLSEPVMVNLPTHICVTRPQWVKQGPITGIILGMGSANERRCYNVMSSLIGWAHSKSDPWTTYSSTVTGEHKSECVNPISHTQGYGMGTHCKNF